eukprot:1083194-Pyramimonas_sp.AAC.1
MSAPPPSAASGGAPAGCGRLPACWPNCLTRDSICFCSALMDRTDELEASCGDYEPKRHQEHEVACHGGATGAPLLLS